MSTGCDSHWNAVCRAAHPAPLPGQPRLRLALTVFVVFAGVTFLQRGAPHLNTAAPGGGGPLRALAVRAAYLRLAAGTRAAAPPNIPTKGDLSSFQEAAVRDDAVRQLGEVFDPDALRWEIFDVARGVSADASGEFRTDKVSVRSVRLTVTVDGDRAQVKGPIVVTVHFTEQGTDGRTRVLSTSGAVSIAAVLIKSASGRWLVDLLVVHPQV